MPFVDFSEEDLLRNKIVDPAWYRLHINVVREWAPTKDEKSNNCVMECTIQHNSDTGETTFSGVPIELQFNDKVSARGFIEGFLKALNVPVEVGRVELGHATGMEVDAYVENNTWQGRISNRVNHKYRAVRK